MTLLEEYRRARAAVEPAFLAAVAMGGMSPMNLEVYLRNDPASRLRATDGEFGPAGLKDPDWMSLSAPAVLDDRTFIWSGGPWLAKGEPAQRRMIRLGRDERGRASVRFGHSLSDYVSQWVSPCRPGIYRAVAHCRARVSPGNETFLIMSWQDRERRYVGSAVSDRLPPGDWSTGRELEVIAQAPAGAERVGIGVYVYHQTGRDFAEFSGVSLSCLGSSTPGLSQ